MGRRLTDTDADQIPSQDTLTKAFALGLEAEDGSQSTFQDVVGHGKTIVVFIRHFHCGMCQKYVAELGEMFPVSALEDQNIKLVVIGCGNWTLAKPYADVLNFKSPIYADSKSELFDTLGMVKNLDSEYLNHAAYSSSIATALKLTVINAWKMGAKHWLSGGNVTQLGGEFIFVDGQCVWAHRMRTARDHTDPANLAKASGFTLATAEP